MGFVLPKGGLTAGGVGGPFLRVISGDFDGDGDLTAADIDWLARAMREDLENAVFDLNQSANVDAVDHPIWLEDLAKPFFGDANLDGEFDSSDMVQVLAAGKYETGEDVGWAEGDWNGDGPFNSSDMVTAFVDVGYEKGLGRDVAAVPEPGAWWPPWRADEGRPKRTGSLGVRCVRRCDVRAFLGPPSPTCKHDHHQ